MGDVAVYTMSAQPAAAASISKKPQKLARPRETVAELHRRRAIEQRAVLAKLTAMSAAGSPLSVIPATAEHNPASGIGFVALHGKPADLLKAGWSAAFASEQEKRA